MIGREAGSGTKTVTPITKTEENCQNIDKSSLRTGDVITTVSSNPSAIGYASFEALWRFVKSAFDQMAVPCDVSNRYRIKNMRL
ncbi:hypothetical protein [Dubosiella newyorkensis]|uniref:hypothetical protein n=1 Tax=Dubosiella newyorkensis TaxID=1862672 RepID=UPI003F67631A